jgi:hypothetical protein
VIGRDGTIDSSQREYGKLGTVEQVEQMEQVDPESAVAVVDGGGLAWQEFAVHAKLYGKVVRIRSDARCYGTLTVPFLMVLPVF